jgi:hypothetical protein
MVARTDPDAKRPLSFRVFGFDGDLDVRGYFAMQFDRHVKLA